MGGLLSITVARDWCHDRAFLSAGLRPCTAVLADGSTLHLWSPAKPSTNRRPLLLLHGFGARAAWQWSPYLKPLYAAGFDLYVPDLIFFGQSYTKSDDRSDSFQARCVMAAMIAAGVPKFGVVGVSYGGFVGYRMAAMYPSAVDRAVLCCAGVCLEEKDLENGLFAVKDVSQAAEILLPQRPEKLRELVRLTFVRPPVFMPSCCLWDYIKVMCSTHVKEKTELLYALIRNRKLDDLPKIKQPTLILWGDQDRVFPLELGERLKCHIGENAELVVIKNAGHAVNLEKPRQLCEHIKSFFFDSSTPIYSGPKD